MTCNMRNMAKALMISAAAAQFQQQAEDSVHHDLSQHLLHGDRSDAKRSFEEICAENGFAFEMHEVTTVDGYILNVFRIPGLASESEQ